MASPAVHPNYLATETDCRVPVAGMKISRMLAATDPLRSPIVEERNPGAHVRTDEELLESARQTAVTIYHPVGTCKMGPAGDAGAVVDPRLRIHGIAGLRVVDASIMPTITSGNTNAPAIMIAENADARAHASVR